MPDHADSTASDGAPGVHWRAGAPVIEVAELRSTVLCALRLFAEAVVVPTLLLTVLLRVAGLVPALATAVGWCLLALSLRWVTTRRLPGTLVLGTAMVVLNAAVALGTSSALVYLLSPVLGSVFMAVLFVGSALLGRPVTLRLARDYVAVPDHLLDRCGVRRMFVQVALIWGASRVLDVATSLAFMHHSLDAGLMSRSVLSPTITLAAIVGCVAFGVASLRRAGVSVRIRAGAEPAPAPTPSASPSASPALVAA